MIPLDQTHIGSTPDLVLSLQGSMSLEDQEVGPRFEALSQEKDLRWAVSKKKDALFSSEFDETVGNDSFISVATTASLSSTLDEDSPPQIPRRRRICFAETVLVREFDIIMGDDRVCDYPLTLSWEPSSENFYNMEERETERRFLDEQRQQQRRVAAIHQEEQKGEAQAEGKKTGSKTRRFFAWPHHLSRSERRDRLRSFGYSNTELVQSLRKRRVRLSMDYAYGHKDSIQALQAFRENHFRYII
jgi:hypothetical protein